MSHYPAVAWGGEWAYGGGAPRSALAPSTAHQVEAQWDDTEIPDPKFCHAISSKTNSQCQAYPKKGTQYCVFHSKMMAEQADSQAAADGAEPTADS